MAFGSLCAGDLLVGDIADENVHERVLILGPDRAAFLELHHFLLREGSQSVDERLGRRQSQRCECAGREHAPEHGCIVDYGLLRRRERV